MNPGIILLSFGMLASLAVLGVPIAYAFIATAVLGTLLSIGSVDAALTLLSQTVFSDVREYTFVVLPMFTAMGTIIAYSGAARDVFVSADRSFARVRGRLAVATIAGNAMFAAVTGVGIAAAAAFSRIAYPQMTDLGYKRSFAAGCIAGSSVLGLLIPPSVFMIIWAILTEQSVGRLFVAGVAPGLILTFLYMLYVVIRVTLNPTLAPDRPEDEVPPPREPGAAFSLFGILFLIVTVLGGIWFGLMTPTEASAIGLLVSMIFGWIKGMRLKEFTAALMEAGRLVTPLILLLIAAKMFSRFLALEGVPDLVAWTLEDTGFGPTGTILLMCAVWLVLGMLIDSVLIMLLTVPIFYPISQSLGMDPIAFALVGILVIEAGVLTPPFGLAAFVVKGAIDDPAITIREVFEGSAPYAAMILVVALLVGVFPAIATFLPSLM
ncbi:MAG: TRAP transporter large permease [Alphaproteobacteria bacterium]|nr:TRAP transporter large permease [Alphaproteobacteria bacterium]